eukprot:scaffold23306_cov88-Skeletonema_marinoi.AAC.1
MQPRRPTNQVVKGGVCWRDGTKNKAKSEATAELDSSSRRRGSHGECLKERSQVKYVKPATENRRTEL